MRKHTELTTYTREQIEQLLMFSAKLDVVGPMLIGRINAQRVRWLEDGLVEVVTEYERGDWNHAA